MTDGDHDTTDPLADDAQTADHDPGTEDVPGTGDESGTRDEPGRAMADGDVAEPGRPTDPTDSPGSNGEGGFLGPDVERKLKAAGAIVLGIIATYATFQVYFSLANAIELWLSDDFVPVFQAAFNLIVVLVALAGIVWLVRELS